MLEKVKTMISLFMRITAGVLFVTAVYITVFFGMEIELGVEILWQILSVSVITTFGSVICIAADNKVSKIGMLLCHITYFLYVNAVVLLMGWYFEWFHLREWKQVLGMLIAILFVYVVVMAVTYWMDYREAEKMNRKLKERG